MTCLKKNIENIAKSGSTFVPTFVDHRLLPHIRFNGHCLINDIYVPKKVINLYIYYQPNPQFKYRFTLCNCSFGFVKLTKNADLDKYKYSGNGIKFDSPLEFLYTEALEKMPLFLELMYAHKFILKTRENIY